MAELAVKLVPANFNFWNTLGVVRYRASDWAGSVQATLNSMRRYAARELVDWFVLAMAQWRLGEKSRAEQLLKHAERRLSRARIEIRISSRSGGARALRRNPRQCRDFDRSWHAR